jgi:hypothetical protein
MQNSEKKRKSKVSSDRYSKAVSPDKQYQYVQGGFSQLSPPQSPDNSTTSLYAAFDSALRASSYNMFCSPLIPVQTPTPFRSKQVNRTAVRDNIFEKQSRSEQEVAQQKQQAKDYLELGRYMSRDAKPTDKWFQKSPINSMNEFSQKPDAQINYNETLITVNSEVEYERLQGLLGFERMGKTSQRNSASFKGNATKFRKVHFVPACFILVLFS